AALLASAFGASAPAQATLRFSAPFGSAAATAAPAAAGLPVATSYGGRAACELFTAAAHAVRTSSLASTATVSSVTTHARVPAGETTLTQSDASGFDASLRPMTRK